MPKTLCGQVCMTAYANTPLQNQHELADETSKEAFKEMPKVVSNSYSKNRIFSINCFLDSKPFHNYGLLTATLLVYQRKAFVSRGAVAPLDFRNSHLRIPVLRKNCHLAPPVSKISCLDPPALKSY